MPADISIVECSGSTREYFRNIWAPWLKKVSGRDPEPEDERAVSDPEAFYIATGGMVYFAQLENEIVGCVAVRKLDETTYEFCKLVVKEKTRGKGIGKLLVERCLDFARSRGAHRLMLQTFRLSAVAIDMYKAMGFVPMQPPTAMHVLARTEIIMGMELGKWCSQPESNRHVE